MSSETTWGHFRLALAVVVTVAGACADFERGDPLPVVDAGLPETAGEGGAGLSFAKDIHPLLLDRCRRCHTDGAQAGNTAFLLGGAAAADYDRTLPFVKKGDAAGSRLLTKGAGTGHGGGALYAVGSTAYQRVAQWIQEGALP